jgi:hypothetical protein
MARSEIVNIVGEVRYSPDGLLWKVEGSDWAEVLAEAPKDYEARSQVHASPAYRQVAAKFMKEQRSDPIRIPMNTELWVYRDKVAAFSATHVYYGKETRKLLIKHRVLEEEAKKELLRKKVEDLERGQDDDEQVAYERIPDEDTPTRLPIPRDVKRAVWRRDRGQCANCGSRERLEFDHIVPIAKGGSNTERNVQLLCEACNRSKGATI